MMMKTKQLDQELVDYILTTSKIKYFWHTDHKIFDVEFYFEDAKLVMFSFPNNNVWIQEGPIRDWIPSIHDSDEIFFQKSDILNDLILKLKDVAVKVFNDYGLSIII
jgi:hypothetical protein